MKAIVLAGGAGTRLRDAVPDVPKPMAPVAGKPFLEYLVRQLKRGGIEEIVLSTGYKRDLVRDHFAAGAKWGVRIEYSEEAEPLGTGGAIVRALRLVDEDEFVVANGDSFLAMRFDEFAGFHRSRGAAATMALVHRDDAGRYGAVDAGPGGRIVGFAEKSATRRGLINGGVYLFRKDLFGRAPRGPFSLERELLPRLVGERLYGMVVPGFFIDIGVPADYRFLAEHPELLDA